MLDIFNNKPANNVKFMLEYLEKKFGEQAVNGRPNELINLQRHVKELESKLKEKQGEASEEESARSLGSHEDTDEDESDDYIDDLPEQKPVGSRGPRASVSAEAFGAWN